MVPGRQKAKAPVTATQMIAPGGGCCVNPEGSSGSLGTIRQWLRTSLAVTGIRCC
jgi:hypothetical protein